MSRFCGGFLFHKSDIILPLQLGELSCTLLSLNQLARITNTIVCGILADERKANEM